MYLEDIHLSLSSKFASEVLIQCHQGSIDVAALAGDFVGEFGWSIHLAIECRYCSSTWLLLFNLQKYQISVLGWRHLGAIPLENVVDID